MKKIILTIALVLPGTVHAIPFVIDDFPSYSYVRGCSPTAAAMVLGYWDNNGFDGLFDISGDAVFDTLSVDPDIRDLANFMLTDFTGRTRTDRIRDGIEAFTLDRGSPFESYYLGYGEGHIVGELYNGRPVLLNVAMPGYSWVNHSIAAFGFEYINNEMWLATYNGWHDDERINWYAYSDIMTTYSQSILSIRPTGTVPYYPTIPEPATGLLYGAGLLGLCYSSRKGRRNPQRSLA